MLLQCGERSEWTISRVPRTLTVGPVLQYMWDFSILMLIYKPLVPPGMLRVTQNEVLKETAGDGKVIAGRKMKWQKKRSVTLRIVYIIILGFLNFGTKRGDVLEVWHSSKTLCPIQGRQRSHQYQLTHSRCPAPQLEENEQCDCEEAGLGVGGGGQSVIHVQAAQLYNV